MSRRKAEFNDLPATRGEAVAQANEYALLSADMASIEAERAKRIAEINADIDERLAVIMPVTFEELTSGFVIDIGQ